jgi:hypothetical protein
MARLCSWGDITSPSPGTRSCTIETPPTLLSLNSILLPYGLSIGVNLLIVCCKKIALFRNSYALRFLDNCALYPLRPCAISLLLFACCLPA